MTARSLALRIAPLAASCLLHAGLVAGALAIGLPAPPRGWPVLQADLVPAEPAVPPRRLETPPTRPAPPTAPPPARAPQPAPARAVAAPAPVTRAPVPPAPGAPPTPPSPAPPAVAVEPAPRAPTPPPLAPPGAPTPATTGSAEAPAGAAGGRLASAAPTPPAGAGAALARATPGEGVTQAAAPRGGYQVRPTYPGSARRLGIEGTTLLRVLVDADGRVGDVAVQRSAGHPDLDRAAADAVRRWRFEPARLGRDAVAMWVLLPVEFRLK